MICNLTKQQYKILKNKLVNRMLDNCEVTNEGYLGCYKFIRPNDTALAIKDVLLLLEELFEPNIEQNWHYRDDYIKNKAKEYHYFDKR